ncbi:hypothetical protein BDV23DRAFT_178021 [Aspergillus alliaceus]|uniref:Major facilitator superfamily domain-containing protein n=2 Tax=Petromyces alliaceus TaxID=209559 RepID=A0A5N7CQY5_PETAA|nr:hypothetical protein BDV23DRAFT_178021 [Aspergillus alliaceus]
MVFWLAESVGTLLSGFPQSAAYTNLNGVHGHAGWRWLFIIDGIITLPLALAGFFFFPNLPQDGKKTWWTTEEEHILSVKRMEAIGRAGKEPWTVAKVKRILLNWHTYLLRLTVIRTINLFNSNVQQISHITLGPEPCLEDYGLPRRQEGIPVVRYPSDSAQ